MREIPPPPPPSPYEQWFVKEFRFSRIHHALHQLLHDAFEAGRTYEKQRAAENADHQQ